MQNELDYLKSKLNLHRDRVLTRYDYYNMKNQVKDFRISTPPELTYIKSVLGWCGTAVDSIADRLQFYKFENDNYGFSELFATNNQDILIDSAITGALIGSCSFVYISLGANGTPRLQVINAYDATGIMDPFTRLLKSGYAVLERDDNGEVIKDAYFLPNETIYYEKGRIFDSIENPTGVPLLVPVVYRPDGEREFGHSVISRACMSIMQSAARTIKRSEISAEFYSFPQKYVTGLAEDAEDLDKWKAAMSTMLSFTKDEEGDHPIVGQFQQQSMTPHIEQLRVLASLFAGETGLTLDDLGISTDNPSSAEAIKAGHEQLRLKCRKAQRNFATSLLNIGYVSSMLRDETQYNRSLLFDTKVLWEPLFEPDASMLGQIGDGIIKLNQSFPEYLDSEKLRILLGF